KGTPDGGSTGVANARHGVFGRTKPVDAVGAAFPLAIPQLVSPEGGRRLRACRRERPALRLPPPLELRHRADDRARRVRLAAPCGPRPAYHLRARERKGAAV